MTVKAYLSQDGRTSLNGDDREGPNLSASKGLSAVVWEKDQGDFQGWVERERFLGIWELGERTFFDFAHSEKYGRYPEKLSDAF